MSELYQEKMNDYWGERAVSYSEQNQRQLEDEHRETWKNLILHNVSDNNKKLKILDIGTGPGFFAILMAQAGHEITAVDMNKDMLEEAKHNAVSQNVIIKFEQVEDTLPYADESFDMIISRDVSWTLLKPEVTLSHWFSKVKKGGSLLYFDADWYGYLRNEEDTKAFHEYHNMVKEKNGFSYKKAGVLEEIAYKLPMTHRVRPDWDMNFWSKQGITSVTCQEKLNSAIYRQIEQMQYEKQQEFLITVNK